MAILSIASAGPSVYVGRKEPVDWATAADRCKCWGGQLATFSSNAEYAKMVDAAEKLGRKAWIGLKSEDNGQTYRFIDRETDYWCVDQTSDMTKPVTLNARPHCLCFSFIYFTRSLCIDVITLIVLYSDDCSRIEEWYPNEPNNAGSEDCAELYNYGGYGRINNIPCNQNQQYYICEFDSDNYAFGHWCNGCGPRRSMECVNGDFSIASQRAIDS